MQGLDKPKKYDRLRAVYHPSLRPPEELVQEKIGLTLTLLYSQKKKPDLTMLDWANKKARMMRAWGCEGRG